MPQFFHLLKNGDNDTDLLMKNALQNVGAIISRVSDPQVSS